jgi:hypothetical protein
MRENSMKACTIYLHAYSGTLFVPATQTADSMLATCYTETSLTADFMLLSRRPKREGVFQRGISNSIVPGSMVPAKRDSNLVWPYTIPLHSVSTL